MRQEDKTKYFLLAALFLALNVAWCQSGCEDRIRETRELYENGDYNQSIQLGEKSLRECRFNKKEREQMLELLAKSQLENDDVAKAENTVVRLLENNPYYEIKNEALEPEDYVRTVKKFDVHPLLSIGIKNAVSRSGFRSIGQGPPPAETKSDYRSFGNGWYLNYYGWLEFQPFQKVSFNAECIYYTIYYYRTMNKDPNWSLDYREGLTFAEIPFYIKRTFSRQNLLYSFYGGFSWQFLTGASATVSGYDYNTDSSYYDAAINRLPERRRNNFQYLLGGNVGYRFNNLRIFLDFRYFGGLTNLLNENVPQNYELLNTFRYADNPFRYNKGFEIGASACYVLKTSIRKKKIR
jgi:hypothetical protein